VGYFLRGRVEIVDKINKNEKEKKSGAGLGGETALGLSYCTFGTKAFVSGKPVCSLG